MKLNCSLSFLFPGELLKPVAKGVGRWAHPSSRGQQEPSRPWSASAPFGVFGAARSRLVLGHCHGPSRNGLRVHMLHVLPPPATEDTIKSACSSGDLEGHLRTLLYVYLTAEEPHWYPMCREPLRVCPALTFPVSSWGFTGLCRNSKSEHWLLLFSIFLP